MDARQNDTATTGTRVLQPPSWAKPRGFANGVAARGTMVFVAGQVGWDEECRFGAPDLVGQVGQALKNIVAVLKEAGGRPEHIVRLTWYVTDRREFQQASKAIGAVFREIIGSYDAAMTAVEVTGLMEEEAKVEVEATAVIPD